MSPKTIKILAGIFAVLLACWFIAHWFKRRVPRNVFLWNKTSEARRLSIHRPNDATVLIREEKQWKIQEPFQFPAAQMAVEGFLDKLSKVELSEPLSTDPKREEIFAVNESSAIRLKAFLSGAQAPALDVLIGRSGADYDTFFMRRPEEHTVFEARGLGRYELDKGPAAWADTLVCAVDESRILSLQVQNPKGRFVLRRNGKNWFLGEGKTPLSAEALSKFQPLLTGLTRWEADGVVRENDLDPALVKGLKQREFKIELRAQGQSGEHPESIYEFTVGPRGSDFKHLLSKKGVSGFFYKMAGWRLEPFRINPDPAENPNKPRR